MRTDEQLLAEATTVQASATAALERMEMAEALRGIVTDFDTAYPFAPETKRRAELVKRGQALDHARRDAIDHARQALQRLDPEMTDACRRHEDVPHEIFRLMDAQKITATSPVRGLSLSDDLAARTVEQLQVTAAEQACHGATFHDVCTRYRDALTRMDPYRGDPFVVKVIETLRARQYAGLRYDGTLRDVHAIFELEKAIKAARAARVPADLHAARAGVHGVRARIADAHRMLGRQTVVDWDDLARLMDDERRRRADDAARGAA